MAGVRLVNRKGSILSSRRAKGAVQPVGRYLQICNLDDASMDDERSASSIVAVADAIKAEGATSNYHSPQAFTVRYTTVKPRIIPEQHATVLYFKYHVPY